MPLRKLAFVQFCDVIVECLQMKPLPTLQCVIFAPSCTKHWSSFHSLLSAVSISLRDLTIVLNDEETYTDMALSIKALESCNMLERFDVSVSILTLTLLDSITAALQPAHLKQLHYTWNFVDRTSSSSINRVIHSVESLVILLKEHRYHALSAISFNFETDLDALDCLEIEGRIMAASADLLQRKILRIHWAYNLSSW
ncbi:hypothetical protein OBBRIDRAFT_837200 [Obba rivulosa]|uniref:Uncharacterized protein n=1 Tax=Obba rivulosa TaxID=1052685 RepID=A0A8E2AVZ3_9APHY|nr:hypothetical protein OBBRIDRAFT_837200 [Obba rivulosa]